MKLIDLFETVQSNEKLGIINGIKFIIPGGTEQLPSRISAHNLQIACRYFSDVLIKIKQRHIELHTFYWHLKHYNVVMYCSYNINTGSMFINQISDSSVIDKEPNLSVMEMDGLYEVFDTNEPVNYNGYRILDDMNLHGAERIEMHGLKNFITRAQVEQMMKEAVENIIFLKSLGFYTRFAQVYSESAQQAIIIKARRKDNLVVIKTYLPHTNNRIKPNVVMFRVS